MKLVHVISELKEEIPILVVDLDDKSIRDDKSIQERAYLVANNIENINNKIYVTSSCGSTSLVHSYKHCFPDWFSCTEVFLESLRLFSIDRIQLAGIYKELCIVEVAKILQENDIEVYILDNDLYSISAEASVVEGDDLENRLKEVGCKYRYV